MWLNAMYAVNFVMWTEGNVAADAMFIRVAVVVYNFGCSRCMEDWLYDLIWNDG
jgi:hypothetical protein